jgi:hypothetical protein
VTTWRPIRNSASWPDSLTSAGELTPSVHERVRLTWCQRSAFQRARRPATPCQQPRTLRPLQLPARQIPPTVCPVASVPSAQFSTNPSASSDAAFRHPSVRATSKETCIPQEVRSKSTATLASVPRVVGNAPRTHVRRHVQS